MSKRQEMYQAILELLNGNFRYGGYASEPTSLPYGNYAEQPRPYFKADNTTYKKIHDYVVRVVTEHKDFDLEEQIEDLFDDLKIPYDRLSDEDIEKQHVHCTEWIVEIID